MSATVHLGFRVGGGEPVAVPLQHFAVTGQTQLSGKTTTLEALVERSGLTAVAFVTKRAEGALARGRRIAPYFRERSDWQFVSAVLEATLRERLKFERSWIMRACKGARRLADVQANVRQAMLTAKGMSADVYLTLDHYLDIVIPQIERLPYSDALDLERGLNVVDLVNYTTELQALVIRSVIEWVYERGRGVLTIIPEAWEFIPQARGSPVLLACEQLIRKGGASGNFVWLDSQDIAGVHKNILRQVGVWVLGVQREANEVKRTLAHVPGGVRKPSADEIMQLERGQFFACFGRMVEKVYVQPAWLSEHHARLVATGAMTTPALAREESEVDAREASALRDENAQLCRRVDDLTKQIIALQKSLGATEPVRSIPTAAPPGTSPHGVRLTMDAIWEEVKRRAAYDPGVLALLRQQPEVRVSVERRVIEASEVTLYGRLACLIVDGFFDEPRTATAAHTELQRLGRGSAKPNVYRECDKLAADGFLTKEAGGYQAVRGMKVNVVERRAA